MKRVVTNSYEVIEAISCLHVYMGKTYMCSLHGKTFNDFSYNGKVDRNKLEEAINGELDNNVEQKNK